MRLSLVYEVHTNSYTGSRLQRLLTQKIPTFSRILRSHFKFIKYSEILKPLKTCQLVLFSNCVSSLYIVENDFQPQCRTSTGRGFESYYIISFLRLLSDLRQIFSATIGSVFLCRYVKN